MTDDTAALIGAYDFVLTEMDKATWNAAGPESDQHEYMIYLPAGTYLVSNTIIYSEPWRYYPGHQKLRDGKRVFERLVKIRFVGERREQTIIRLADQCPGFEDPSKPKAVVSFGKSDLNNAVAYNAFRHLTVDTGTGNPAAIGIDFCGANNAGIHDVTVISRDGQGVAGIDFRICPAMGYHNDITVRGFDYGIRSLPYHMTHNSLEFVTFANQNKAGVQIGECSASIRKLHSRNRVPAVEVTTQAGQAVLVDSRLEGQGKKSAAIESNGGQLFVRNTDVTGYGHAIQVEGRVALVKTKVDEFVTGDVVSLRDKQRQRSLNLPIKDPPNIRWETDMSLWASVDDYGAKGDGTTDDSAAVQAAMNSGKPVVYFPKAVYQLSSPVDIPSSVHRVTAFYGSVNGTLNVSKDHGETLLLEDFGTNSRTFVRHRVPRTLMLSHIRCMYFNENRDRRPDVFINNCNGLGKKKTAFMNGNFWVRFMNTEYKAAPNFTCNGSDMWVLGYKVEGHMTNFESIGGGRLEVLGGICNEHGSAPDPSTPVLRNVDSSLCFVGYTNGPQRFETIVEETVKGQTKRIVWGDLPSRRGTGRYRNWKDAFLPLYVSEQHKQFTIEK